MSQENVELVRGLQPTPETDLVTLFRDEAAFAALIEAVSPFFHEDFEVVAPALVAGQDAATRRLSTVSGRCGLNGSTRGRAIASRSRT